MIIVFGRVDVAPDHLEQARRISREHVARSRAEPGCISHAVYDDPDRPGQLVFVEEWESEQALMQHFAVPASIGFARELARLAASKPVIRLLHAKELPFPRGAA